MTQPQAMIFDLDGTLADTLAGIAASMNRTLAELGFPTHPTDAYRRFVGNGVGKLVERALPPEAADRVDEVTAIYRPRLETEGTAMATVYPGIDAMLDRLAEHGVRLAVLSNKPHEATGNVVAKLFPERPFDVVRGHVDGTPVKPDPTSAIEVLSELGVQPLRAWYIGDSDVDMQLARNADLKAIGVAWGLRGRAELQASGADHVIDKPGELIGLLDRT